MEPAEELRLLHRLIAHTQHAEVMLGRLPDDMPCHVSLPHYVR